MNWISVKDRLPVPNAYKNILFFDGLVRYGTYQNKHGFVHENSEYLDEAFGVTHWMYLPEPPKD